MAEWEPEPGSYEDVCSRIGHALIARIATIKMMRHGSAWGHLQYVNMDLIIGDRGPHELRDIFPHAFVFDFLNWSCTGNRESYERLMGFIHENGIERAFAEATQEMMSQYREEGYRQ